MRFLGNNGVRVGLRKKFEREVKVVPELKEQMNSRVNSNINDVTPRVI